ncbi:MAG: hybrid sensor histidine kinase/response regulator [Myxococcota bacterium]
MNVEAQELKLVIVDDAPADGAIVRRYLRGSRWRVVQTTHLDEMLITVRGFAPDVVLLDYALPGSVGWEHLEQLRRAFPPEVLAIAVWSGSGDEAIAAEAMRLGAQDYLVKGELSQVSLCRALDRLVEATATSRELALRHRALLRANHELERANEELVCAARERAALMAMVGHDMRGPLSSLFVVAEEAGPRLDSEAAMMLDASLYRLKTLSRDLQSLGTLDAGGRPTRNVVVDVGLLVQRLLRETAGHPRARREHLSLGWQFATPSVDGASVRSDPGRLQRVLGNVLENACGFARSRVSVKVHPPGEVEEALVLHVDDDGPGVPAATRGRIFDRFVSFRSAEHGKGTGLGLAYVRRALDELGGDARVGQSPLGGARFTLVVPNAVETRPLGLEAWETDDGSLVH